MTPASREAAMSALWEVMRTPAEEGGRVAVVQGPPGVGKTHLVERFAREARATGAVVRQATGTQTGQDVPLGLVDQLFGDDVPVGDVPVGDTGPAPAHSCASSAARLCTPCQSLASRAQPMAERFLRSAAGAGRVVLVVDDPHLADPVSLWVLRSLLDRLRNLPVLLVVSGGYLSPTRQFRDFQSAVSKHSSLLVISLSPLTFPEGAQFLRELTGIRPGAVFMKEVMELTGGNVRLLAAIGRERKTLPYLTDPLTRGQVPFRIAFSVRLLLGGGHIDGLERVARALAVVDAGGSQALISAVSGVGAVETGSALELMDAMGLTAGGVFRHPVIRAAVLEDPDFTDRVEFHRSAARLLHRQGAPVRAVARCLETAGVAGHPWERAVLREAARHAQAEGKWAVAVRCLELAYGFASGTGEQAQVLIELACAKWRVDVSAALSHLPDLVDHARRGRLLSQGVVVVSEMLAWSGQRAVAHEILDLLSDRDREEYDRACGLLEFPGYDRQPGTPHTTGSFHLRWGDGHGGLAERAERAEVFGVSREMIRSYFLDADQSAWVMDVGRFTSLLLHHVCLFLPTTSCDGLAEEGRDTMSPFRRLILHCLQSVNELNAGRPAEAEEEARRALADPADWGIYAGLPLSVLITAQVHQGRFEEAKATLRIPVPDSLFTSEFGRLYLHARGLYRMATGMPSSALGDFLACGEIERRLGVPASPVCPWQAWAAMVHLQLGHQDEAVRTAEAVVAEAGAPWGRAIALRVLALARPIERRADLLRDTVGLLEGSPHRVDLAMGLYDLGRTQHALGSTKVGRVLVRRAWNMARYSGFEPLMLALSAQVQDDPGASAFGGPDLADDFWEEPAGALGLDGLSAAERRVAWLAGIGHSNREMADRLCVTVSTVEQHLTKIYRKLGLKQRADLLLVFPIPPDGMIP
ncbi:AAA family ATPase [Streptomyces acidiscabies]|uniref:AAA family ATPase n=1 Tax=Streptomyces acidiscabies TaxID=42234 RepID=UPI0038F69327